MSRPRITLRRIASWLTGAATLVLCERLGTALGLWLALPVPGSVLGMLLLLFGLMLYGSVPAGLADVSGLLLRLLALLFLPAAVGVYFLRGFAPSDWLALLVATTVGTLFSLLISALLLQWLLRRTDPGPPND
ncbi:holin-like protein CidA [Microbulbifer aestuariivivens]|uniref:Holin-like protein CidA n=1 Tax=Microbulbifer aestuariivivens TaxID=1908308 RepID=A0ABP9WV04_9GAMM